MFSLETLKFYVNYFRPELILIGYTLILAGCFSIINQTLYFTYFWQLKEYRLDRMNDFLLTKSGLEKVFPHFWGAKMVGAIITIVMFVLMTTGIIDGGALGSDLIFLIIAALATVCAIWEFADFIFRAKKRRIYRPDLTAKSLLVVFLTAFPLLLIIAGYCYFSIMVSGTVQLIYAVALMWLVTFAVFPFNSIIIFMFWPITLFEKNRAIVRATHKVAQTQGLRVIGITGSYGKSSTKEFLAAILESKFKVLKTPGNTNTDIGVAGVVMRELKPEHEVFIVECGAYKIGEIKKIVDLVKPRIGIVTAVKDAHLGLFGSLENIKKAKFELIEGLPEFGTGIFNADSEGAMDLARWAKEGKLSKVITYSAMDKSATGKATGLKAEKIRVAMDKVSFEVDGIKFELMVCGAQSVSNALAAIAAALEMGVKLKDMVVPLRAAKLREHTMSLKKVNENLVLIDDMYNANPDGVIAGLEYLNAAYKDWQKILVFPGMLELGNKTAEEHKRVAEKIEMVLSPSGWAYFTSKDYKQDLESGLGEFKNYQFIDSDPMSLLAEIRAKIKDEKTVILFVSRGSESVLKALS